MIGFHKYCKGNGDVSLAVASTVLQVWTHWPRTCQ